MSRQQILGGLALLLLISPSVHAHLLNVFVYAEGDRLQGSVYFSGGVAAAGAQIRIQGADDQLLAELSPDAQGEFSFQVPQRSDYRVVADTGDGHRAEWRVSADELGPELADVVAVTTLGSTQVAAGAAAESGHSVADAKLAALVERAVARQVGPLRKALQQHDERVRLADVLGGIGFIFGLAGTLLWWRNRR